jgi:hypothetical protein
MNLKSFLLSSLFYLITISQASSQQLYNDNTFSDDNNNDKLYTKETYNYLRLLASDCSSTSYSKSDIENECSYGPSSYDRILKYSTFSNYIGNHDYHSNGLNYVTSLLVDSSTHHFGNFMNDGVGMIILYIIDGLFLLAWIPILCCWKKRCCLFDDCLYDNDCCLIFWHILTYFLAAAILSFLIVVLCFGA